MALDIDTRPPYKHQEYPKMVYHPDGRYRVAATETEHQAALDAGWSDEPLPVHLEKFQGGPKPVAKEEAQPVPVTEPVVTAPAPKAKAKK